MPGRVADALYDAGVRHERSGKLEAALSAYRETLQADPTHLFAAINLGGLFAKTGDLAGAEQVYRAGLEHHPRSADLLNGLGYIYLTLGRDDAAKTSLEQAVSVAPELLQARLNLASLFLKTNRTARAHAQAKLATVQHPGSAQAWTLLGETERAAGHIEAAHAAFAQAAALAPDDMYIRLLLSTTHPALRQALIGKTVVLRRHAVEDAAFIQSCYDDTEFSHLVNLNWPTSLSGESIAATIAHTAREPDYLKGQLEWVIHRRTATGLEPIGLAALIEPWSGNRSAEFLLGIKQPQTGVYRPAVEASLLLLDLAFDKLGLERLNSFCYLHNRKALENTLALGFTQEGILRNYIYDHRGQAFLSVYLSSMLAADYRNNPRLKKLASKRLPAKPRL